jgi:GNAT superfamily N-acetyltransferase
MDSEDRSCRGSCAPHSGTRRQSRGNGGGRGRHKRNVDAPAGGSDEGATLTRASSPVDSFFAELEVIRGYRESDESQITALLAAAWPDDPVMVEISALHGPDLDGDDRRRRTLVVEEHGALVGSATRLSTPRHPTFSFFTAVVAPELRRRGIASALLEELLQGWEARPLLARVRETDDAGVAFLLASSFSLRMRSRSVTVDPADPEVVAWADDQAAIEIDRPADREEVARAHERAYERVHAGWAPTTNRPLEESLRLFCGEGWLPESAVLARTGDEVVGVGSLYGAPSVFAAHGLFMIVDTLRADGQSLRSLVAAQLEWARARGTRVSFEADEANTELWQLMHELPAERGPELLLLSTETARLSSRVAGVCAQPADACGRE